MNIWETVNTLSGISCPPGREAPVAGKIAEIARPFAGEIKTDVLGNLIVRKPGKGAKVMLAANKDTPGVVVTHIDKNGFLRFAALGELSPAGITGLPVLFSDGRHGIVACGNKAGEKSLRIEDLFIDTGASDRESAGLKPGDTAVFDLGCRKIGSLAAAAYLESRVACAVLLSALEKAAQTENDVYFVFAAQGNLGFRGAKTAAYDIAPDFAFCVDGAPAEDMPGAKGESGVRTGGGAVIKILDGSAICSPEAVKYLRGAADSEGIAYQDGILDTAAASGMLQSARAGVYTGGISVPVRYFKGPVQAFDIGDAEACAALAAKAADIRL